MVGMPQGEEVPSKKEGGGHPAAENSSGRPPGPVWTPILGEEGKSIFCKKKGGKGKN